MEAMTDREARRWHLSLAAEGNPKVRENLLRLYAAWRRGKIGEFDLEIFKPGTPVRIVNQTSAYNLYLAEIIEVSGQAGQLPIRVRLRIDSQYIEINCEVWEVVPLEEEDRQIIEGLG